jgi:integral membrane sensor domain MASE1
MDDGHSFRSISEMSSCIGMLLKWLVTRQELNVSTTRKRVAIACALVGALAFIQGPGHNVAETPVWAYFVAPIALAILASPFVIAVGVLRAREHATGQTIPIGAITAFVWFFAGPIGLYFLHKRFLSTRDHEDQVVRSMGLGHTLSKLRLSPPFGSMH